MPNITNLTHHLLTLHSYSQESREIADVISQIVLGAKFISREVNKAGLVDILGSTGKVNIQQEEVQKLDEFTDNLFTTLFEQSPQVGAYASEENDDLVIFDQHGTSGQYFVLLDPLDGSSNIDVNVSVGTIFAIYKKEQVGGNFSLETCLLPGTKLVAAGYVVYGSSTMLVYSTGSGAHGFTLDPSLGEFLLSNPHMRFPQHGTIYSINESYEPKWDDSIKNYIQEVKSDKDISGKPKSARYVGSLISDFHRNLLKGGIYLYPADKKNPNGKLRLMFEAIPLAFLAKQAGGYASDGQQDILKLQPRELHQRVPLFIGNKADVERIEDLLKQN